MAGGSIDPMRSFYVMWLIRRRPGRVFKLGEIASFTCCRQRGMAVQTRRWARHSWREGIYHRRRAGTGGRKVFPGAAGVAQGRGAVRHVDETANVMQVRMTGAKEFARKRKGAPGKPSVKHGCDGRNPMPTAAGLYEDLVRVWE